MSLFTNESIERVRDSVDFVEVASAYTDLRRAGERFTGLCPFHEERTPSFSLNARDKVYFCFGCEAKGDLFTFVQEKEGLGFADAVEALAGRYGVELERESEDPRQEEARRRRARLGEVLERTAAFYASFLWDADEAAKARAYLAERGLGAEALREFGVGYAPSPWDTVVKRGQVAGFSIPELGAAGLVQKGQKGPGFYDRFRARIMFPVRDARGRVQGFGARATREGQRPKYLNSPEGELYRKKRTLYGIDLARPAIAKAGRAVVVEGYTDVIAAHQAGVKEAVAVMGTAITPEQVQLLAAHAEEVVLALDADRAGREAMLRAQRVASGKRVRLRVAAMEAGRDPADLLAGESAQPGAATAFREAIEAADDLPVFHVKTLLEDGDLTSPQGRDRALDEVVPVLAAMPDSITREALMSEVADRLDADPGLVVRRVGSADRGGGAPRVRAQQGAPTVPPGERVQAETRPLSVRERRERALLAMCIAAPAEGREFLEQLTPAHLSSPLVVRAKDWLEAHLDDPLNGLPREDEDLGLAVAGLVAQAGREPASHEAMELNFRQLELAKLEQEIENASRDGGDLLVDLQRRRGELTERIARWEPVD
jgi:DNA primase